MGTADPEPPAPLGLRRTSSQPSGPTDPNPRSGTKTPRPILAMMPAVSRSRSIPTLVLVLALVLGPSSEAHAGPWAPEPGSGYAKLWLKYLYGFGYFDGDGDVLDYGHYSEIFVSAYAELGLFPQVALVLHTPILQGFLLENPREGRVDGHLSPGDPTLSIRWQALAIDRFAGAVEVGLRAPFARPGPVQTVYGTSEGMPAIGALEIGTGVWDVPVSISAGYGWDELYLAASVGYVLRTGGFDHVLTWSAEAGTTFEGGFGLRGRAVGWHALDLQIGDAAPRHQSPSGIGNGTSYIGFAIEGDYEFEPGWFVGLTFEGGLGPLRRQTGGPVVTTYLASRF